MRRHHTDGMNVLSILAMRRRLILVLEVNATLGPGADRALPAENTLRARRLRRLSSCSLVRHRVRDRVNVEVMLRLGQCREYLSGRRHSLAGTCPTQVSD